MVKGFKVRCEDLFTITQINASLSNLPLEMDYEIIDLNPLDVNIFPKTERVKLAMYKDKLEGKKKDKIEQMYLDTIMPFFRQYVKHINKMEVIVYD